ncbi:Uncharacterised protein [uncultured archaeon]|nr:Uncharacterised protein [uncultured archaeon]
MRKTMENQLIIESILNFVKNNRTELGAINGILYAIGIIELTSNSFTNSILAFVISSLMFSTSFIALKLENQTDNIYMNKD